MFTREIHNLTLTYMGKSYECAVPSSVYSVLSAAGESVDELSDKAVFSAEISLDSSEIVAKQLYLGLAGMQASFDVLVNGKKVKIPGGVSSACKFSVKELLVEGVNKIEFVFGKDTKAFNAGIFKSVSLFRFKNAMINKISLKQTHDNGSVTIGIGLDLLGNSDNIRAVATLVSSAGQIYYGGFNRGRGSITLADPLFWWPKGFGVQNLYKLTVNLYGDVEIEDSVEMKIGLRTVKTEKGSEAITVNGVEILPMGATYYPDKCPDFASYSKKTEALVTSAAMAGYNCILVPADAQAPSDLFYDLCDVHGIIVIEEMPRINSSTLASLERRAHHACLVLLDVIDAEDSDINKIGVSAPNLAVSVREDLSEYPSYPSLPSDKTVEKLVDEDERNLFSYSIEQISSTETTSRMLASVAERYPYPSDLSDFAYASALASSYKLREKIWTARLSGGKRRAIFSTLGDERAVASPSAIDCQLRWKPIQYYCMRSFAPLAVYARADGCTVSFKISNMRKNDLIGSLEYRIVDSSNMTIYKSSEPCEISAFSSSTVLVKDFTEYVSGHIREYYVEYFVKEGVMSGAVNTLLFVPEKHFKFKQPNIKAEVTGTDRRFSITLSADCFVKDLELDFDGVDAVFSENYIDLTSASPIKITLNVIGGLETAYHLNQALRLRSVYDLKSR